MKKLFILAAFILGLGGFAEAQVNPHAIGVRLGGDGNINGAEISYQHGFGSANRLELDLGFNGDKHHDQLTVAVIYHWDWNLTGGLNWFIGPGAMLSSHTHKENKNKKEDYNLTHINIGVGGQIGLEYDFKKSGAPILLSLDARPMWDLVGEHKGLGWGSSLGIRYVW